jgi:hypothetical protein
MAKVVAKRPNGAVLVEIPAADAAGLEVGADVEIRRVRPALPGGWPTPFGAPAGRMPSIELEDIKAARSEALRPTLP